MFGYMATIILSICGGLLVTVGVAWSCAITGNIFDVEPEASGIFKNQMESTTIVWRGRSETFVTVITSRFVHNDVSASPKSELDRFGSVIPYWAGLDEPSTQFQNEDINYEWRFADGFGWPCLALSCGFTYDEQKHTVAKNVQGGIRLPLHTRADLQVGLPRALPLRPIWIGLVVDAAVYATSLGMLMCLFSYLRRRVRSWRGFCGACGYDLRGDLLSGCPECGWRRKEKDAVQPA